MLELYLFIFSAVIIVIIVAHRVFVVNRDTKSEFKKEVSARVEENRREAQKDDGKRFKEEHIKSEEGKKHDLARFKNEMRHAEMAISKKDMAEAKKSLIQAMSLTNNEVPVAFKLAGIYMETSDFKRAEALYRKLLDQDMDNPDIYENLGKIMLKRKAYREAVQAYVRAVELDDKDDRKFIALGKLYHLMMRYGVAAECFKRAAELKPREVNYLFLLADSCKEDDDYENALFTYERILTMEPYNERAKSSTQDVRLKIKEQEVLFK